MKRWQVDSLIADLEDHYQCELSTSQRSAFALYVLKCFDSLSSFEQACRLVRNSQPITGQFPAFYRFAEAVRVEVKCLTLI